MFAILRGQSMPEYKNIKSLHERINDSDKVHETNFWANMCDAILKTILFYKKPIAVYTK
jgi:hypothetical protein